MLFESYSRIHDQKLFTIMEIISTLVSIEYVFGKYNPMDENVKYDADHNDDIF